MMEIHFAEKLPMMRMASAALLLSEQHEVLIVKPIYQEYWLFLSLLF